MRSTFLVSILASLILATSLSAQTTTYSARTGNNTSACSEAGGHCEGPFVGMGAIGVGSYQPAPGHVSDVPLSSALYTGNTTRFYAHLMPWFTVCSTTATTFPVWDEAANSGQGGYKTCNNHVETGYTSDDPATVQAQLDDMLRRGFGGVVINWYGEPDTCPSHRCMEDNTVLEIRDNLAARCSGAQNCPMLFSLDVDQGTFKYACANNTDPQQPTCILNELNQHFDYADQTYFGSNAYLKESGRPIVSFFIAEGSFLGQCKTADCFVAGTACRYDKDNRTSTDCWAQIWDRVDTHIQGYANGNPKLIFRDSPGFTHVETDGAFAWKNRYKIGCSDPDDTVGLCSMSHFYSVSLSHPSLSTWGAAWKGSGNSAPWDSGDPVMPQRCGRTWLDILAKAGSYYSTSRQLPYLQVVTWNDYDEGTAMEMGIDNCWAVDASLSGSILSWDLRVDSDEPDAATHATEDTIDHYVIWDSPNGEDLTAVGTVARGASTVDLNTLTLGSSSGILYVEAVGRASILNKMSNGVPYGSRKVTISTPARGGLVLSPVRVVATATSSTPVTLTQIYVDGTKRYEENDAALDTTVSMSPGNRRLTVQAYDAAGNFKTTEYIDVCALSTVSPSVTICTPQGGALVGSPVRVLAGTTSANPVTLIQIYVDGTKVHEQNADRLDQAVTLSAGATHRLTVQAYDSTGALFKSTVYVTVP